jgi:hypothetical protein
VTQHRHRLTGQRQTAELVGVGARRHREREVEAAGRDLLGQRAGTRLPQPDLDIGVAPPERGEERGHTHSGDALLGAHGERAAQHALHRGHGVPGRADLGEDPLRLGQQGATGLRERDAAGGADEQRGPQLTFQGADRGGQARLRHHQPLRGTGEMLVLGDGDKVLKVAQFHD